MSKQWINTKVEYQWSDELGELVQLSKEGYWYEGEMTLCITYITDTLAVQNNEAFNATTPGQTGSYGLHFWGQSSNNYANGITWQTYGTGDWYDAHAGIYVQGGSGYGNKMYFATTNSTSTGAQTRMMIDHQGRVGIGTIAPTSQLAIGTDDSITRDFNVGHYTGDNTSGAGITLKTDTAGRSFFDTKFTDSAGTLQFSYGTGAQFGWNTEWMQMKAGNVGIGVFTNTAPSYKLEVAGSFYASGSSIEYKEDVEPYTPPEGALMSLKPVQYQYKDAWKDFGKRYAGNSSKQLGLVAEDVAKVLPELAVTKTEDGKEVVRNVDYEKLTVLLVSEVQSLRKEVNDLSRDRAALEAA